MRGEIREVQKIYESLRQYRPQSPEQLKNYAKVFLGLDVPSKRVCPEHNSPLEYLWYSFSSDFYNSGAANSDSVVWANRAGGKTILAAAATLLDCLFKPGCQVRILAGSGEQAGRMYDYLLGFLPGGFERFISGSPLKHRCRFNNSSSVEVLSQSPASVRGRHVHKLRCDEVELFEPSVYEAAKFTTLSDKEIIGGMELISTMHRPGGLMQQAVNEAGKLKMPVFKWCVWEVIEKCTDRNCSSCPLLEDCQGRAKNADGYLQIDDCITILRRSSRAGFEAEMLCGNPYRQNAVFDEFDPSVHIKPMQFDPALPLYRAIDFGFVNPFVCLWIQVDDMGLVRVIDEYVRSKATIDVHGKEIEERTPIEESLVAGSFCDPSGSGTNDVTGTSAVRELRAMGISLRYRKSAILQGIELIRRAVRRGDGKSYLVISPRCRRLIEAMQNYHYSLSGKGNDELPEKDGVYDHPIDALRYFFVNYTHSSKTSSRLY